MQETTNILSSFTPITLEEMDCVRLLNRVDTKFLFPIEDLGMILEEMKGHYRILEISGVRASHYENEYFDTADLRMYMQHHNGKLNRFKIRIRTYLDTNQQFFEIKFKNNKERTIKERIKKKLKGEDFELLSQNFLAEKTPYIMEHLKASLLINFTRMTFVNNDLSERITIDTGLKFRNGEKTKEYPAIVIAEVKQDQCNACSFISLMRKHRLPGVSISKYCLGIISLYDGIKCNRFKSKLNLIKKHSHVIS